MAEKHLTDGTTALAAQPRVIKIEAAEKPENARLRVAAYTRVSSDSDDQLNSFAAQNRYYAELISGRNPREIAEILNAEDTSGRIWKYKSVWRIATKPLFHRNYSTVQKNCGKDAASGRLSPMEGSASGCAAPAAPASGQSKSMEDGTGAAADTMKKATAPSSPCRSADG